MRQVQGPRQITPDDHPDNASVFTASSLIEALLHADQSSREGRHVAIWHQPGIALANEQSGRTEVAAKAQKDPELQQHYTRALNHTQTFRHRNSYIMASPGLAPEIEKSRGAGAIVLRCVFGKVVVDGRTQEREVAYAHFDEADPEAVSEEENLFQGQHVRLVRVHYGPNMGVYDAEDRERYLKVGEEEFRRTAAPKWEMQPRDVAFFTNLLLHSPPDYEAAPGKPRRTLDIIDCYQGIPLPLVRKFG